MTDHAADPGGRFETDTHRRLLGAVPNPDEEPMETEAIMVRLDADPHVPLATTQEAETEDLLDELEAQGYIKGLKDGVKMTKEGRDLLSAPPPEPGEEEAA